MEATQTLEERLAGLDLTGEETEDLDFSEEVEDLMKDVRWLSLFKVHRPKLFSHAALFNDMRFAWKPVKDVTFKIMGENLFLAQFHYLGDWNKVMEGGPWLFRGAAVAMEEYDGFGNVHDYKLDKIPVWSRIRGIPEGLMKKKELAEKVEEKVGERPIKVDIQEGRINPLTHLRSRVYIRLARPFVRVVPISLTEKKKYLVQHEKLPTFCYVCGHIGHELTECGDGVHVEKKCQWGSWLMVQFPTTGRNQNRGEGLRGGTLSRGWGRGRGRPWTREDDEMDYDVEQNDVETEQQTGRVAGRVLMLENSGAVSPAKLQEKKRARKEGEGYGSKQIVSVASSQEEGDRAQ